MSWLDGWLNQTVSWEARASEDTWEGNTYSSAVSIRARKEMRQGERIGPGGMTVPQVNTIYVREEVGVGDKIDGEIIQGRIELGPDMDGNTVGYELRTEP